MSTIELSEEQTKLLRLCLKHSDPIKPNWEKVAEEGELVSTSAASQRWGRLHKVLMDSEKPSTPGKAKGSTSKGGGRAAKQKNATNKKSNTTKSSKTSDGDASDETDGKAVATTKAATHTPKKRAHDNKDDMDSGVEDGTSTKKAKKEIKDENEDED